MSSFKPILVSECKSLKVIFQKFNAFCFEHLWRQINYVALCIDKCRAKTLCVSLCCKATVKAHFAELYIVNTLCDIFRYDPFYKFFLRKCEHFSLCSCLRHTLPIRTHTHKASSVWCPKLTADSLHRASCPAPPQKAVTHNLKSPLLIIHTRARNSH